ncbi:D-alanyl-D-alanine carboxypeptidase family protein [Anaerococcus tetradius]|uniref:D-alanyl-D-alanine carboxypeptidase family protein n=1 Tax=Anaerococcus tetradius TaxID=33036 RepID=UPI0023F58943|nr:D-alanyl-D-alanine carboxypeptidase family protein [Anaerococcus tetradius]
MKFKKTMLISLLTLVFLLIPGEIFAAQTRVVGLDSNVSSYLIGNEETGDVYYEKNADEARPMASLTKLMTFLLVRDAIEEGKINLNTSVKADKKAEELTSWEYSSLGLKEKESYSVEELLQGLIAVSGNDCAYLLAKTVAGSEEKFATLMNEKSKELGLSSQKYYNASGIETKDNKENQSSARDLFKLSSFIVRKYPDILRYSTMDEVNIPGKGIRKTSTIPLRKDIKGVDGLKTGTTDKAGYCLVTTVDMKELDGSDDFRCIGVVMGADQKDTRESVMSDLIYYISRFYSCKKVLDVNKSLDSIEVGSAKQGYIELYPKENLSIISNDDKKVATKITLNKDIKAPIKKGDILGKVDVSYDNKYHVVDLVSGSDVERASLFTRIVRNIENNVNFLVDLLIAR